MSSSPQRLWAPPIALAVAAAVIAVIVAAYASQPAPAAKAGRGCDEYAATTGSNSASGSRRHPFRTPSRLVQALRPGETGCLRGGTYSFAKLYIATPRIKLTSFRGRKATLAGDLKILPSARGAVLARLHLDGSAGANRIGPRIYADKAALRRNVITNRHARTCVYIAGYFNRPPPTGVKIDRNRIHDCGRLPATNHNHGIYVASARRASITGNWIYDNADRGIQLYPNANGTLVRRNVIDSNGQGLNFGGDGSGCSNGNTAVRNVIANSNVSWNVYSGSQGSACRGNRLRRNCVFSRFGDGPFARDGGIQLPARNFRARRNRIAAPQYVNRAAGDFRLRRGSACAGLVRGR